MSNTSLQPNTVTSLVDRNRPDPAREMLQLVSLGRENGWPFRVLGRAPLPDQAVRLGDWLLVPAHMDSSDIPERTLGRIRAIFAAGIRPKGFVLVHEAPMLLPSSGQKATKPNQPVSSGIDTFISILGVGATAVSALASILFPAALLMAAAMLDPILVAVTEDDHWIEIDRWWTE